MKSLKSTLNNCLNPVQAGITRVLSGTQPEYVLTKGKNYGFYDASRACGISESIYRAVDVYTKYAKNHTIPLYKRVPLLDRLSKDWIIYDGKEV